MGCVSGFVRVYLQVRACVCVFMYQCLTVPLSLFLQNDNKHTPPLCHYIVSFHNIIFHSFMSEAFYLSKYVLPIHFNFDNLPDVMCYPQDSYYLLGGYFLCNRVKVFSNFYLFSIPQQIVQQHL